MKPHGYCHCGCGERTLIPAKSDASCGDVKGQPRRFIRGHSSRLRHPKWETSIRFTEDGCWEWTVSFHNGYGQIGANGNAHRMFYEAFVGPIPDGLQVDHLCRNRPCVNPDHLEAVTQRENIRRSSTTKLTPDQVREIRQSDEFDYVLAERFGVSRNAVQSARVGDNWQDLDVPPARRIGRKAASVG